MNIIQVGQYPLSADCIRGGVESSVFGLANALSDLGHTIYVLDNPRIGGTDTTESQKERLLTVYRYANKGRHNQDMVKRQKDILDDIIKKNPDVVHIHGTSKLSAELYQKVKNANIPVILTVHGLLHEEKKQSLLRHPSLKHLYQYIVQTRTEFSLLSNASSVIVDTNYVKERISHYYNTLRITQLPNIHIIPQGINEHYYHLSCNRQSNTIVSIGSISPRKGHLYTIDMFNTLRAWGTDVKLSIIGTMADQHYYNQLLRKIEESPYSADIILQTNLTQTEVYNALESAKLFVLHSQEESQGIVFAEAMAVGLPIVTTKQGGIPYVVENGKSGFLCDFGDTKTMAEMAERLLTHEELWQSFSIQAKESAKQYGWNDIADKIIKLYTNKN